MAKVMEGQEENNKISNFIRISTMMSYLIFTMLASYGIQFAMSKIPLLFDPANQFISSQTAHVVSSILSFIPFPFSSGFLLATIAIGFSQVPTLIIVGSICGVVLQFGLAYLTFRKALLTLQEIVTLDSKKKKRPV